jgi:hypothetical protein
MALLESDNTTVQLTENGDLYIDPQKGLVLVGGITAVIQAVRFRLGLFKGEWFLNLEVGVDWYGIIGEQFDEDKIRSEVNAAIGSVPGIVQVTELTITYDNPTRTVTVTWAATTLFGDTPSVTVAVSA